jgi:hypothetical protein
MPITEMAMLLMPLWITVEPSNCNPTTHTLILNLQPDFPQAHINRGNAYARTAHFVLAIAGFRRAGQNPLNGIIFCSTFILLALLTPIVAYRRLISRTQKVAIKDTGSTQA